MKIFRSESVAWNPGDPNTFTGVVRSRRLGADDAGVPVHLYHVEFNRDGRTNWHIHSGPQWLLVVSGRIKVQQWGQPAQEIEAGDAVVIPPGEKHWHGTVPGSIGAHLALNVHATTEWLEPVTDEQYRS